MKKLNYAKYLIAKEWLPLFIVFTLIGLVSFFAYLMSFNFYDADYSNVTLAALTAPMMVFAIVLPLFVFNYKYSLKRGDTYYQLPLNQRDLKNTRVLTGLFVLAISFIIAASLPYFAYTLRYIFSPDYMRFSGVTFFKYLNAGALLGSIGIAFILVITEYFISCYFTSLTSKPVSALLISVSFHIILIFTLYSIFSNMYNFSRIVRRTEDAYLDAANIAIEFSPGPLVIFGLPDYIARVYAYGLSGSAIPFDTDSNQRAVLIVNLVLELLLGSAACFLTLFKKDDSGESCNNYGFANKKLNSLFFLSVIPVVLFALSVDHTFGFEDVLGTVIAAAAYYFLFALFIGTFKMPSYAYIIIGVASGVVLMGCLILPWL